MESAKDRNRAGADGTHGEMRVIRASSRDQQADNTHVIHGSERSRDFKKVVAAQRNTIQCGMRNENSKFCRKIDGQKNHC